ncbi:alpha-amylase family glycosyl hydrolase [soil metagenome]
MLKPTLDWWRGATLYQVYPRSFADSHGDAGWDGVGDLPGVTAHLPYIASLGVDGLWLSPVFTSPMRDFGYDVADHRDIDPMFGTLADFDALIQRAHALGLKVIIDQVWSHTAIEHAWFQVSRASRDSAQADWYVWADAKPDGGTPNNWLSWMGGPAWTWEPRRKQYYFHNFLPQMPDLNFHCPAVQDAVLDLARFWLARGVDGFRLDTANLYFHSRGLENNPPAAQPADMPVLMQRHAHNTDQPETLPFLERLRAVMDEYGASFSVGEIGGAEPLKTMTEYTAGRSRLHSAYSFAMLGDRPRPADIARQMADWQQGAAAEAWPSWAFSNHDVPRVASRWGGLTSGGFAFGRAAEGAAAQPGAPAQLWLALLAVLRGTLFIYQGEELGLPQAEVAFEDLQDPFGRANWPTHKGRDGCRTPMPWLAEAPQLGFSEGRPWLPVDAAHRALAVDLQNADPDSCLTLTRRLIALRRAHPALRLGAFETLRADERVLQLRREFEGDVVVAAFNLSGSPASAELPEGLLVSADAVQVGDITALGASLRLGAWSALIQALPR